MFHLMQHELKYYFKNKYEAIYIYSYFISILLIIPFAVTHEDLGQVNLATLGLWVALTSASAIGANTLFRRDREQGLLEYYQLLPVPLEAVIVAKWAAFYLFLLMPLIAALPIAGLLFSLSAAELWRHALGLIAGALGLSILATLLAALLAGIEKAGALLSLLILPLSLPILIFGVNYCRDSLGTSQASIILIVGFAIFILPIMSWAGASAIRNSN